MDRDQCAIMPPAPQPPPETGQREAEAVRDLIRARLAAVRAVRAARQQLSALLLRHERLYPGNRTPWTKAHRG
jgi:hypothetical protein